ncbi:MAG: aspartyl/asparaginyl beta-hydroxylase domain-containing protein [Myxococcaceae bacterium]
MTAKISHTPGWAVRLRQAPRPLLATSIQLVFKVLIRTFEWWVRRTRDGGRRFFSNAEFPWIQEVEAAGREIAREFETTVLDSSRIPNFQDVMIEQRQITTDDRWKTLVLCGYGHPVPTNLSRFPCTSSALVNIPGMKSAMFSILRGQKEIPPHRGPFSGVLRYHLAIRVPQGGENDYIEVGGERRSWREGESLVFDDTHIHRVHKGSVGDRVVLFVDFLRPLPWPLSTINRAIIHLIASTPYIRDTLKRVEEWKELFDQAPDDRTVLQR